MDKKIGILTFSKAHNYGAMLQCYALSSFLRKIGYNVFIIDYVNPFIEDQYKKKSIFSLLKPKLIYRIVFYNSIQRHNPYFANFANKEFCFAPIGKKYDVVVFGSDQIWNPNCNGHDPVFFGESIDSKKIAFSASMGGYRFSEQIDRRFLKCFERFSHISVREKSDAEFLSNKVKRKVFHTLDPVFLLEKNDWDEMSRNSSLKMTNYVLVYTIIHDNDIVRKAKDYAKHIKAKIVYLNNGYRFFVGCKNVRGASPYDFVSLIKNSKAVFTNSFHGICFSFVFKKTLFPFLLKTNVTINNRILDFLTEFDLADRISKEICENEYIDYSSKLSTKIEMSKKFLLTSIND